jgi:imidazole glycerol phosphate synthase subunit HisF
VYLLRYSTLFKSWWVRTYVEVLALIIIPAIDLHEGRVVRLKKGRFDEVTVYSSNPADMARSFQDAGAGRIHVVDLDGSVAGKGMNVQAIAAICSAVEVEWSWEAGSAPRRMPPGPSTSA